MSVIIKGGASQNLADVNSSNYLKVALENSASQNPTNVGCVRFFSESDAGDITGEPKILSPETDDDYRLRTQLETLLDTETFNYTAQNTGKHTYSTSTLTTTWSTAGVSTNGGAVTTTGTGTTFGTYAEFPILGVNTAYFEFEAGFTQQPTANVIIDFGAFRRGAATAYAPTDGAFFRMTSAGLQGVISNNGSETTTATFGFSYNNNEKHQFIITISHRNVDFWIDDQLHGTLVTPLGQGQPFLSATLPLSVRHAHVGTAGSAIQFVLNNYAVSIGGLNTPKLFGEISNGTFGSYQGLSGGTMGSLSVYTNSTNPTAAVPSNTALTANLPAGLGGQAWETFTAGLAQGVDGILMSYQVPAGTTAVQGKRLKITAVKLASFVQTTMTNSASMVNVFTLAFGHTAVSLATTEAATTKARRIVLLPELTQTLPSASAIGTLASQQDGFSTFDQPIYVNPGEFVQTTVKHVITGGITAGVLAHNIQYVYSWE
jgi:hypothetical protein